MGPWLNGIVPRYAAEVAGLNVDVHRGREQSSWLGRQERPRQFPLSLRRWRTRCNKDSPRASLTREAASRGSTSRRRLAAPGLPSVSKLPVTQRPLVPFRPREASKASGSSRPIEMRVGVNGTIVRLGCEWRKRAPSRARGDDDAKVRDRA
jgi:hypothetical protein